MNRSSNVFNTAPLGSGGASNFIFIAASLVCQATYGAVLKVGRKLKSSIDPAIQSSGILRAGRQLKCALQAQAVVTGNLRQYVAVYLAASLVAAAATQAKLSKWHRKWLSSAQSAAASVTGALRKVRKVGLAASQSAQASSTAVLSAVTQKFLSGAATGVAIMTGRITKGIRLRSSLTGFGGVTGVLNESSRVRAAAERIAFIPPDNRVVFISKGK